MLALVGSVSIPVQAGMLVTDEKARDILNNASVPGTIEYNSFRQYEQLPSGIQTLADLFDGCGAVLVKSGELTTRDSFFSSGKANLAIMEFSDSNATYYLAFSPEHAYMQFDQGSYVRPVKYGYAFNLIYHNDTWMSLGLKAI